MFRGFKGYIQADAHCVYDALFRGEARVNETDKPPDEVACWSHARRKWWEAAIATKDPAAREALLRVRMLFKLEEEWKGLAPKQRHDRRQRVTRPMLDDFFAWSEGVFARVRDIRGPVATAFGYAIRQREALRRFLAHEKIGEGGMGARRRHHRSPALRPRAAIRAPRDARLRWPEPSEARAPALSRSPARDGPCSFSRDRESA
jgi:hypothetical protein